MIDASDFLKWLNIFNVTYGGNPGTEVVISWNGSTNPVDVTAGSGIDITDGVISLTGTGPTIGYGYICRQNISPFVISFTNTTNYYIPLIGNSVPDISQVNNFQYHLDGSSHLGIQYLDIDPCVAQITFQLEIVYDSSNLNTNPNAYELSANLNLTAGPGGSFAPINIISGNNSGSNVPFSVKPGESTIVTMTFQVPMNQNDVIYPNIRNNGITTSSLNAINTITYLISAVKIGDVGGTSSGVASINGLEGDIDITSTGGSLNVTASGSNVNVDISSPVSIANGGTNKNSQTSNGINFFDGTSITSNSNFIFDGSNNVTLTNSSFSSIFHIVSSGSGNQEQLLFTNTASGINWSLTHINSTSTFNIIGPPGAGTPISINPSGVINLSNLSASTILSLDSSKNIITTALSGDITSSGLVTTLSTVNSNVGSFGSATQVGTFTVNAKGLITAASNVTITGVTPGGSAGGDLSGTYPNPTVAKINTVALGSTTATSGNLLIGSGTQWVTQAVSGDVTINSTGVTAIGTNKVTNTQIRQSFGYSVVGNSTGSLANVADLVSTAVGQVLRRDGSLLEFGSLDLTNSNTVGSSILPQANGGTNTTGSSYSASAIIFQNAGNTAFSSTGNLTYGASGLQVYNSTTISLAGSVTAPTITTLLNLASSTQNSARLVFSGQEFYQASNTSTDGVALILGVNRSTNRQLWLGDSALLAVNSTNRLIRIQPNTGLIDSIATDGSTALSFQCGNTGSATTVNGNAISLTGGDTTLSGSINVTGSGKTFNSYNGDGDKFLFFDDANKTKIYTVTGWNLNFLSGNSAGAGNSGIFNWYTCPNASSSTLQMTLATNGNLTLASGNIILSTATSGYQQKSAAVSAGTANATLVTGVVLSSGASGTINNSAVTTSHIGFANCTSASGTITFVRVTCGSGTFTVTGGSLDNSTYAVLFVKAN